MKAFIAWSALALIGVGSQPHPDGLDELNNMLRRDAVTAANEYEEPDSNHLGTAWRPRIVDGRFSSLLCQIAYQSPNEDWYLRRIAERFRLSPREQERLRGDCAIWADGHNTPADLEEPLSNAM